MVVNLVDTALPSFKVPLGHCCDEDITHLVDSIAR